MAERRLADVFFRVKAKVDAKEVRSDVDRGIKGARLGEIGDREGQLFSKNMINGLNKRLKSNDIKAFGSRWSTVLTAALALGPAVIPAAGVLTGAILGIGAAAASAGAALGVFGATVAFTFKDITDQTKKVQTLYDKIILLNEQIRIAPKDSKLQKSLETSQKRAVNELQARLNLLEPGQRAAVSGFLRMRGAVQAFIDANKPTSYAVIARGLNIISLALPHLEPLFKVGARAADSFLKILSNFVTGGDLDKVVSYLARRAGPAIKTFTSIFVSLVAGVAGVGKAFGASGQGVIDFLDKLADKFAKFGQGLQDSDSFASFIKFLQENGPDVVSSIKDIATALFNISKATAPLAPITFAFIKGLASLTAALPTPVLTGLIGAFIAFNIALRISGEIAPIVTGAMKAMNFIFGIGSKLVLGTRIQLALLAVQQKLTAAATLAYNALLNGLKVVQELWRDSLLRTRIQLIALRIQVILTAVAEGIASAATTVFAAAMTALGVAVEIATGPIGIIILIIAALVIGLILAYKHSDTFRRIVDASFRFVAASAKSFWEDFLKPILKFLRDQIDNVGEGFKQLGHDIAATWGAIKSAFSNGTKAVVLFFLDMVGKVLDGVVHLFGWVPGVGGKLKKARDEFRKFRDGVNDELSGIKNKNITVTAKASVLIGQGLDRATAIADALHRASGGPVFGAGTSTSDSIPALLSNGEHVMSAQEVSGMGGHSAVSRMRSMAASGQLTGFASGGPVVSVSASTLIPASFGAGLNKVMQAAINIASSSARRQAVAAATSAPGVGGSVARWLPVVLAVLSALRQPSSLAGAVLRRIGFESGGNPFAINLTDSNARAGTPSQGLVQTIPGTFFAYAGPYASRGITDPFANIYAGMNYALHRYGSIAAIDPLVRPRGYRGGLSYVPSDDYPAMLHKGERVLTAQQNQSYGGGIDYNRLALAIVGAQEQSSLARDIGTEIHRRSVKGGRA